MTQDKKILMDRKYFEELIGGRKAVAVVGSYLGKGAELTAPLWGAVFAGKMAWGMVAATSLAAGPAAAFICMVGLGGAVVGKIASPVFANLGIIAGITVNLALDGLQGLARKTKKELQQTTSSAMQRLPTAQMKEKGFLKSVFLRKNKAEPVASVAHSSPVPVKPA